MTSKNTFNKKERLLQLPTKCSCNNLQKCFAISYKKVLQKTIYSLVETAKANDLNVYQYLYTLLLYMLGCLKGGSEGIEQLMPWSDFIKERCTGLIDVENIASDKLEDLPH